MRSFVQHVCVNDEFHTSFDFGSRIPHSQVWGGSLHIVTYMTLLLFLFFLRQKANRANAKWIAKKREKLHDSSPYAYNNTTYEVNPLRSCLTKFIWILHAQLVPSHPIIWPTFPATQAHMFAFLRPQCWG